MRPTKKQITDFLTGYLTARQEVIYAYLFGSSIESDTYRDIDVGIYVEDVSRIGDPLGYSLRLSRELEQRMGCSADVLLMNNLPDHMIHSISRGVLLVDRDDDLRVRFLTSAWSRYFDIAVKRRAYLRAVAGEVP